MKRHKFTSGKKENIVKKFSSERISFFVSAGFLVAVCLAAGIFSGSDNLSRQQYIDLSDVEKNEPENVQENSRIETGETMDETTRDVSATTKSEMKQEQGLTQKELAQKKAEEIRERFQKDVVEHGPDLTGDVEIAMEDLGKTGDEVSGNVQKQVLHFDVEQGVAWPIVGNVIMAYNMSERMLFASLNEYKYNPAMVIAANVDAPISSAASGRVKKTGFNEEIGQYLVMDLGDGYEAVYGQLKDLTVDDGDKVSRGQIIGYVSEPTKYYCVEGSNLYFQMKKDGTPVNPMEYL